MNIPAVDVVVGPDRPWRAIESALFALAAAVLVAWTSGLAALPAPLQAAVSAVVGVAAATLVWRCAPAPPVTLRWDGAGWQLAGAVDVAGSVDVAVDLDAWLLLRFTPAEAGSARWLALSRTRHRDRWHALRCALRAGRVEPDVASARTV